MPAWLTPDMVTCLGLVGALMVFLDYGPSSFGRIFGFDIFVGSVAAVLMMVFVLQIVATSRRLSKEEPARNGEWLKRK